MTSNGYECGVSIDYVLGFLAHTNVFAIIRCQSKWGLKIIQIQIQPFLGIRNELP
jgi:hypothetical protein